MGTSGKQLIFIISQPRSGSTLLQHILGSHSEIHTLPEPWFMLHLAYGLRSSGLEAEYNARYASIALRDFLGKIPGDEDTYIEAIRHMASHLYEKALKNSGKNYFLDKTPRYYFIIHELSRIFPNAKFIFLLRNPLAVFSSILETNFNGSLRGFLAADRKHDILSAPHLIIEGIKHFGDRATVLHYEDLVRDPEQTVVSLCQYIGLAYEKGMLNYGDKIRFEGTTFVDPKSIYRYQCPVTDYVDDWPSRFNTLPKIQMAKVYLDKLGKTTIDNLGYCYNELVSKIGIVKNSKDGITVRWISHVMGAAIQSKKVSKFEEIQIALISSLQSRGVLGTIRRCLDISLRGH